MAKNNPTVHVIPASSGDKWTVKKTGSERALKTFEKQSDAVDWARSHVKENRSEVVIHRKDGTIREKHSYGNDAHPPRDKKY